MSEILNNEENVTAIIEIFKEIWPVELWKRYGLFDESYIYEINTHWLKFPPPSKTTHYALAIFYTLFVFVGTFGNGTVLFMYLRYKSLQTPANALVANLAVSDGFMVSFMLVFIFNSFTLGPSFGSIGCQMYGFWSGVTGNCSICILAAISMDRYHVTRDPLKNVLNCKRVKVSIIFCWFYSTLFAILPLLNIGVGKFVPEGYLTSCSFNYLSEAIAVRMFIFIYFVGAWVLPLSVILYAYINIYRIARNSKTLGVTSFSTDSFRHCRREYRRRQELKLTIISSIATLLWFISWTPYAIVALLGITGNAHRISPFASMVPALFCKTASCLDPFLYALSHPKFKSEIFVFLRKKRITKRGIIRENPHNRKQKKDNIDTSGIDRKDLEMEITTIIN